MIHEINFVKAKKTYLTVTLPDGEKVLVRNPTKRIMDTLTDLAEDFKALEDMEEDSIGARESVSRIYEACALILSNNIARKQITVEYLSDILDVEDLIVLFESYTDFIDSLQASVKN